MYAWVGCSSALFIPCYRVFQRVSNQQVGHVQFKSSCPVEVSHLDHLVLTVKSVPDTIKFYTSVLGMEVVTFKVCQFLFTFFSIEHTIPGFSLD